MYKITKIKKIIFCLNLLMFYSVFLNTYLSANEKSEWKLIKNEQSIQVYVLKSPGQSIVKAKTKTIIHAPMNKVIDILDDIEHRNEWVPFLKKSTLLSELKNNKRIEYSHFAAPWPATDRDFVYQLELISVSSNKKIYTMKSIVTELMPINTNKIRADLYESQYTLTEINQQTTAVELIFYANPKGWLPDWLINIIQRVLPFKILKNLKSKATQAKQTDNNSGSE